MDKARSVGIVALVTVILTASAAADMSGAIERVSDSVLTVKVDDRVGAGFIVSPQGYALTSAHVVGDKSEVTVTLADDTELAAGVEQQDDDRDLALLRLEQENLPAAQFAGSATLKQGAKVAALGSPLGLEGSVTEGVISAVSREIEGNSYLQIDAALNEGNSGGPVIDERGRVIGVATAVIKEAENLGFAIPSDAVITFLQEAGVAVNLALGEGPEGVAAEPRPAKQKPRGPAPPLPARPAVRPVSLLMLVGLPLVISLVVSLLVSLLVARSVRRRAPPPGTLLPQQQPPEEEDLSDIDITLH